MSEAEWIGLAAELALESVRNGWGGPFGAVIVRDGQLLARGQNLVLRTGDPTAHAEVVAIRNAVDESCLLPDDAGRARMLLGATIYSSSFPCPMCLGAIGWARLSELVYGCGVEDAAAAGFDDAFMYEDLGRPLSRRSIPIRQLGRELAKPAFDAWLALPDRRLY